ncbi:MAG TPA: hypothetical protein VHC97_02255 [Thermoanaerobaculia bacterium]|jgi:hypothetical protein|nr:hypothetical protein [Thermoanaerobaculia bacterium]
MPAPVLQLGCTLQCPHGGTVTAVTADAKVRTGGAFALLVNDTFVVAGCPFMVGTKPQPCVTLQWTGEARSFKVDGTPVLLQTSFGLCKSAEGLVQGVALVSGVQTQVKGD